MSDTPGRSAFLAACLAELRCADVPFCISRNHCEFWKDGPSDIDMMVSPTRLNDAERCLKAAAAIGGLRIVARTWFDNLCLVFHSPNSGFVRIDLDTAVRWRSRTLMAAEDLLAARIEDEGLPIPSSKHAALVLLCQCAWAGKVKPTYKTRLMGLTSTHPEAESINRFLEERFRFGKQAMVRLIDGGNVTELRACFRHAPMEQNRIGNLIDLVFRSIRRLQNPPGIVIDCDGISDAVRSEVASNLDLLFPVAKAAQGNNSITRLFTTLFRGGIVWSDKDYRGFGMIVMRYWAGRNRSFRWHHGEIHHLGSGSTGPDTVAADFIGGALADLLAQTR